MTTRAQWTRIVEQEVTEIAERRAADDSRFDELKDFIEMYNILFP